MPIGNEFRLSGREVYEICVPHSNDKDLVKRLQSASGSVEISEYFVRDAWNVGDPTEYLRRTRRPFSCEDAELSALYDRVLRDGAAREIYNELLGGGTALCKQCGYGIARTLDHYFPRSSTPELSVLPINLIPTCRDCNSTKHTFEPARRNECLYHPFFDDWRNLKLIEGRVIINKTVILNYHVTKSKEIDPLILDRYKKTFEAFQINRTYAVASAGCLKQIKQSCVLAAGDPKRIHDELNYRAEEFTLENSNSWQAVMYRTLAECAEFAAEYWKLIP